MAAVDSGGVSSSWVVFHERTNSVLSCRVNSSSSSSVELVSSSSSSIKIIPTFPPLPRDVLAAQAVLNSAGTLLAISTKSRLLVVNLVDLHGDSSSSLSSSPCAPAPLQQDSASDGEWILSNSTWTMSGKLGRRFPPPQETAGAAQRFTGQLVGPVSGQLELEQDGGSNLWAGVLVQPGETPQRVEFQYDARERRGTFSGQANWVQRVGDYCDGYVARDFCFHPLAARSHVVVLDDKSLVRVYNVLGNARVPESEQRLVEGGRVVRIAFEEDAEQQQQQGASYWPQLALYALLADGSILAVSPVAKPSAVRAPPPSSDDDEHLSPAQREFVRYAAPTTTTTGTERAPRARVQWVDQSPGCPQARYHHHHGGEQHASEAVDLSLVRLPANEGLMIHRTWTCGRMDVLYAPRAFRVDVLFKLSAALHQDAAAGPGRGPLRFLRRNLATKQPSSSSEEHKNEGEGEDEDEDGPVFASNHDQIELIRCVDVFGSNNNNDKTSARRREPRLLAVKSDPLAFVCLDLVHGDPVLFKATWATPLAWAEENDNATQPPKVDATRLPSLGMGHTRLRALGGACVFADPNLGVGLALGHGDGDGHGSDAVDRVDLTSRLRLLGNTSAALALPQQQQQQQQDDNASVADAHNFAQYRKDVDNANTLFEHLQAGLNQFATQPVPPALSNRALDSLDEEAAFAAAQWLSSNFDWSANADNSLAARLVDCDGKLAQAAVFQNDLFGQIQQEAAQWKREFEFMDVERAEMERDVAEMGELLQGMRVAAARALERANALRGKSGKSSSVEQIRAARKECQVLQSQLRDSVARAKAEVASRARPRQVLLNAPEEGSTSLLVLAGESDEKDDVDRAEWAWRTAIDLCDEARVLAKRLPPSSAPSPSSAPLPVFLVYSCGGGDAARLPVQQEYERAVAEYRPIRVFLSPAVLSRAQQHQAWRRELKWMDLPHQVDGVGRVCVLRQVVFRVHENNSGELVVEVRGAQEGAVVGQYVRVAPQRFAGAQEENWGIFGHVDHHQSSRRALQQRLARGDRVVSSLT